MANLNRLAMRNHIASDARIHTKASFFNFFKKHFYAPTQSLLKARKKEFSPLDGIKLECALNCENPDERASHLAALENMSEVSLGNYLLEICYSVDHKFCALQLNQFQHLRFEPVSPVCFFEAGEAQQVMRAL